LTDSVSIVLTSYFEGALLQATVPVLRALLEKHRVDHELIVIVDGTDEENDRALKTLAKVTPGLRIFWNQHNIGRGGSVARGIREARGNVAGFIDPDLEIVPDVIPAMLRALRDGAELVVARREVPVHANNLFRWVLSRGYRFTARVLLQLPDVDTESGCKFFRIERLLPVIDTVENQRWFWDTELVARALHQGINVAEVPAPFVRNTDHPTTVRLWRDITEYLRELLRLRRQLRAGRVATSHVRT
jgi:glycosyltransferase involved in cell wall biosynthesis